MDSAELEHLFNPKNVCIIGASKSNNKIGGQVLSNMIIGGFEGGIFPVNPIRDTLFGVKVYRSLGEIKVDIDLAVLTIPN